MFPVPVLRKLSDFQLLQNLIETCANLSALPSTMRDLLAIETLALKWDPEVTPWFPSIK